MSDKYVEYIVELLEPSGGITYRRMFGGYAIYKDGLAVALVIDDEIYFKVDDSNIGDYKAMESKPFTYMKGSKPVVISNWLVPEEILEDQEKLIEWMEKSYKVALKKKRR